MPVQLVLPRSTDALIRKAALIERHPGLQLDKYSIGGEQSEQKDVLDQVCQTKGDAALLDALRLRRQATLAALPGISFVRGNTTGPLTLHLARASALENAGICLHPIYGFVYLPGTGLKGMARAYAETVWMPGQSDREAAWRQIEDVFGWAPNPDRNRQIRDPEHPAAVRRSNDADPKSPEIPASSGSVVFHDAWPERWPPLLLDIVNNHHTDYYQANSDDNVSAPGDWEGPVMVSFLAIGSGNTFGFAISKQRSDVPDERIRLAREWLVGALSYEGAGAKTAAGYGRFRLIEETDETHETSAAVQTTRDRAHHGGARVNFETTLELVTPAFLAGSRQQAADCELRPATLRGLLRWWWRTLHAGFVDVKTLRRLEAAVWGDTNAGGAVQISVEPMSNVTPLPYDKDFIRQRNNLPQPPNKKTTQGLWYHSYGMDEKKGRRYFVAPGARWVVRLATRASYYEEYNKQAKVIPSSRRPLTEPGLLLRQAQAALWLLCHFGGVGSKARKGFGCLADPPDLSTLTVETCQQWARQFRTACGLPDSKDRPAGSASLEQTIPFADIPTPWTNCWFALDQVATVAQEFAQQHKHNLEKKALGLPRNVRPPVRGAFRAGPHVSDRHASPVHFHVGTGSSGFTVRVTAFPSAELPDDPTLARSRQFLQQLLTHLQQELPKRVVSHKDKGRTPPVNPSPPSSKPTAASPRAPQAKPLKSGESVETVFVADPKGQDRRFARYELLGLVGPIVNPKDVPPDKKVGDKLTLIVHSISSDGKQIQFRWATPADQKKGSER